MRRTCSLLIVLLLIVGSIWGGTSAQSASLRLTRLETNDAAQPLGIDDRRPRLSWALDSPRRGISQTAFRVLVASTPELAREGRADIWDSQQLASADPFVVYAGPALKSRSRADLCLETRAEREVPANRVRIEMILTKRSPAMIRDLLFAGHSLRHRRGFTSAFCCSLCRVGTRSRFWP